MAEYLTQETYPWLFNRLPQRGQNQTLQAMQLGVQIRQNQVAEDRATKTLDAQLRAIELREQAFDTERLTREKITAGNVELGQYLSTVTDFTDPAAEAGFWSLGTKNPHLFPTMLKVHEQTFGNAKAAKARLAAANEPPNSVQVAQWVTKMEEQAAALKDTDPQRAAQFQQQAELAKASILSGNESMDFRLDDQGRPVFSVKRGAAAGKGGENLTLSTLGQVQQRLIGMEKSSNMAADLLSTLKPQNLGVAGWAQQVVVDEKLAQVFPELASRQNVDGRTLLRMFNEGMIRSLKADSQINQKEEARLLKMLPSTDALKESFPSAMQKIQTVVRELRDMARTDARAAGAPMPKWALEPDEIKSKVQNGEMTPQEGRELILRYHPSFTPQ